MNKFLRNVSIAVVLMIVAGIIGIQVVKAYGTHDANGQWATMDYADFVIAGTGSMTVTAPYASGVAPPNVLTNRYSLDTYRKEIHWVLDLTDLHIGGTRNNAFIAVQIPEGKYGNATVTKPCLASLDNGTASWIPCYAIQSEWLQWIYIRRVDQQDWPATTTLRLDMDSVIEYVDTPPQ